MKKLMIAAAAAAMIGGVQAADAAYDFVANLQTTTGASVSGVATGSETYVFGDDGAGSLWSTKYWYTDTQVTNKVEGTFPNYTWVTNGNINVTFKELRWTTHKLDDNRVVPALEPATVDGTVTDSTVTNWLHTIWTTYGYGKRTIAGVETTGPSKTECCTLVITAVDGGCYRVAGSNFIQERLYLGTNDCCSAAMGSFTNEAGTAMISIGGLATATSTFLNRYGAFASEYADQVEIHASVVNVPTKAGYHGAYVLFNGMLAGQGNCQVFDEKGNELEVKIPNQIQGCIVGYLNFSLCDVCCDIPFATRAFQCLRGNTITSETDAQTLKTAAFGTFYLNRVD